MGDEVFKPIDSSKGGILLLSFGRWYTNLPMTRGQLLDAIKKFKESKDPGSVSSREELPPYVLSFQIIL